MPVSCCVKNCKSKWKKNSEINFFRFPFTNEKIIKYWIAATGRNDWIPYTDARICSLHFTNNDYNNYNKEHNQRKRLKPDIIPTQHVHTSILQLLQQDAVHEINKYDPNNQVIPKERKLTNEQNDNCITSAILKCPNCSNYNKLLIENETLRKKIEDLKKLQEERLNQQASMFHVIIRNNEAELKRKLELAKNKNKTLKKNIQRKGKSIANFKVLFKDLKNKNILDNNGACKLSNKCNNE